MSKKYSITEIGRDGYRAYTVVNDPGACALCLTHGGAIYPVIGATEGVTLPPFHPNCMCGIAGYDHRRGGRKQDPFMRELRVWIELGGERDKATRLAILRAFYPLGDRADDLIHKAMEAAEAVKDIRGRAEAFVEKLANAPNPSAAQAIASAYTKEWSGEFVTEDFLLKVIEVSEKLLVNPDDLMAVMASESRLRPEKSPYSNAVGLIQFTSIAAEGLGVTLDELAAMTITEQMDYVYKHLEMNKGKMHHAVDIYTAVFAPFSPAIEGPLESPIYREGSNEYRWNSLLDYDKDGAITKKDLQTHLDKMLAEYWANWAINR